MKSTEVRIGNWVKTCIPDMDIMIPHLDCQVQGISLFGEFMFKYSPDGVGFNMSAKHVIGIELTEEWLKKFGFKKEHYNGGHSCRKGGFEVSKGIKWKYYEWDVVSRNEDGVNDPIVELRYVHELQNLYFAITGEELEIIEKEEGK